MRLGYTTWGMVTVRAEEAIPALAGIGYDSIEIAVVPGWRDAIGLLTPSRRRRIKQLLREYELALPALAGNADLLTSSADEYAENWWQLTSTVDLAVEWANHGAPPAVDTYVGGRRGDWAAMRELAIDRVGQLCDYAAERGVTIAIQPHMDGALDTPEKVPELLRGVGRDNLGLTLDINDFSVQGFSVEEVVGQLARRAAVSHVKDEIGRYPDYRFVVPGDGEFDYRGYVAGLARAGFAGDVCVEISLRIQRMPGFDPLAAAAQSYRVLSRAFEQAGVRRAA